MDAVEDTVSLARDNGCSCRVHLFGATVISWVCKGEERIFVSSKSHFDKKKAIRGGVPLVFPQFGPWPLGPQHGFARICMWTLVEKPHKDAEKNVVAEFRLEDSEVTRKMWNFSFKLLYKITLKETDLQFDLKVINTGDDAFDFTCLLHTYLKVPQIGQVRISGLKGLKYNDKVTEKTASEDREFVTVNDNVDRVYLESTSKVVVLTGTDNQGVALLKSNLPDTVVWNPWREKAAAMADFGDDEYGTMVCVEAGRVSEAVRLPPAERFACGQVLSLR